MKLGLEIIIFICFAALTTTPSSPTTILSSQTTTPASQLIVIYIDSPIIFPTKFICLIQCASNTALNDSIATTMILIPIFYKTPLMLLSEIDIIYGIELL